LSRQFSDTHLDPTLGLDQHHSDMASSSSSLKKPSNGFVRVMRRVYKPLGFSKGYNAVLGKS
jgi:hypothetical protein